MSAKTMKKAIIQKTTKNFDEAIAVTTVTMVQPKPNEVVVKNRFVGVNATDINASLSQGTYTGKVAPFDFGLEGVGEIVEVGSQVKNLKIGQPAAYVSLEYKAFAEYIALSEEYVFPVPEIKPEIITLLVCGLTASIGLNKMGRIEAKDKVLITAAAGGTGHIAVQWAKHVGCHVIGTCSSEDKVKYLKSIGCDRPINYKKEDLSEVLKTEYPKGVDVIWETIGGATLEMLYQHLAIKGRLITLGSISSYNEEEIFKRVELPNFPLQILMNSQSISGLLLTNYSDEFPTFLKSMLSMEAVGQIKIKIDTGKDTKEGEFIGVESVKRALRYLFSGKNVGKVIVKL